MKMKKPAIYGAGVILVLAVVFMLFNKPGGTRGRVLAKVGNQRLYFEDLKKEMDASPFLQGIPPAVQAERKKEYLDYKIENMLMLQLAREMKLDTNEHYKQQIESMTTKLLQEELLQIIDPQIVEPTIKDVENYFNGHLYEFDKRKVRLDYIAESDSAQSRQLYQRLLDGGDFDRLKAEQTPRDSFAFLPSGSVPLLELPEDIGQALFPMEPGGVTPPIRLASRFYIVKLLARDKGARTIKLAPWMNEVIHDKIVIDQRVGIYKSMIEGQRAKTKVTVDSSLLNNVKQ